MGRKRFKYRIRLFFASALIWELLFWVIGWQILSVLGLFTTHSTGERLQFLYPNYGWWTLFIIPLIFGVFLYQMTRRNQLVDQLGITKVTETFLHPISTITVFLRFFLIRNALVFILLALMQPAFGTKTIQGKSSGVDLVFAVDVSNSMNTRDIKGGESRLTVAKRVMGQVINQSSVGRVGLLAFAGSAYPQLPLTADVGAAKMYVDALSTSLISNQGTNIAEALVEVNQFFNDQKSRKVLFLITDGEDHEGGVANAYKNLQEKKVEVFVLGIGTEKGGVVPRSDRESAPPMKDELGKVAVSMVNLRMLKEITNELNGKMQLTNESFPNISQFLTQINSETGTKSVDLEFEVKENRYQLPLSIALLLLLVLFVWESVPNRQGK